MLELIPGEWRYRDAETKQIMPWFTKGALEEVMSFVPDMFNMRIWEYGVGDSTAWFRSKGAKCYGVDSDKGWAEKCGVTHMPLICGPAQYCESIYNGYNISYDIIVIDGDFRDECLSYALGCIRYGGMIIIDNYEQRTADLPDWPITNKLIEENKLYTTIYREYDHPDWQTLIIKK